MRRASWHRRYGRHIRSLFCEFFWIYFRNYDLWTAFKLPPDNVHNKTWSQGMRQYNIIQSNLASPKAKNSKILLMKCKKTNKIISTLRVLGYRLHTLKICQQNSSARDSASPNYSSYIQDTQTNISSSNGFSKIKRECNHENNDRAQNQRRNTNLTRRRYSHPS